MINIRKSIFETNSSSTHALVIMTKAQHRAWQDDNFLVLTNEKLTTPENVVIATKEEVIDFLKNYTRENIDEMSEYQFNELVSYYGYLPADNYNSIEGEFEDYIILSAYINE